MPVDPKYTKEEKDRIFKPMIQLITAQKTIDNWKKRVPKALAEIDALIDGSTNLEKGKMTLAEFNKLSTISIRTLFNEIGIVKTYAKAYAADPL